MSTQQPEALRLADILDSGSRQFNAEASDELRRLHHHTEVLRAERDRARSCYDATVKLMVGIHALLYPAPTTMPDGRVMVFRPKSLDPHEVLQELSDRIRALPDELEKVAAIQQAESEPVAALVRHRRIRTPAHCAFDKKDHYSEWSGWEPCTLSYARAITDPARDVGLLPLYEMLPLYTRPAPGVPEFSRIAKRKLDELQEQGFAITGYAIQRGTERGFITDGGFVGWWRSDEAPGVQGVPDGYVLVPLQVLHDASDALGNFIMDHGWGDSDMQAMDNLDAYIAQHTAAQAQKGGE